MSRAFALALVCAVSAAMAQSASAQNACPSGRTLLGGCMNPEMAERARTRSILMVQRRISASAQMTLPRQDREFLTAGARDYIR